MINVSPGDIVDKHEDNVEQLPGKLGKSCRFCASGKTKHSAYQQDCQKFGRFYHNVLAPIPKLHRTAPRVGENKFIRPGI